MGSFCGERCITQHLGLFCPPKSPLQEPSRPTVTRPRSTSCFLLSTFPTPGILPFALSTPPPGDVGPAILQVSSLRIEGGGVSLSLAIVPPDCSIASYPVSQHNNSGVFLLQMQGHAPVPMSSVPGSLEHVPGSLKKSVQTRRPQAPRLSEAGAAAPQGHCGLHDSL